MDSKNQRKTKKITKKEDLENNNDLSREQYGIRYPLHKVITLGDIGILEHVLPSQIDKIDLVDHLDRSPLQLAVLLGKHEMYKALLSAKANVMIVDGNRFVMD